MTWTTLVTSLVSCSHEISKGSYVTGGRGGAGAAPCKHPVGSAPHTATWRVWSQLGGARFHASP